MNSNDSRPRDGSGMATFGELLILSAVIGILAMCFGQDSHAALLSAVGFLGAVGTIALVWLVFWPVSFVEAWYALGDRSVFFGELILAAVKSVFLGIVVSVAVLIDELSR